MLAEPTMDQRPFVVGDDLPNQLAHYPLAKLGCLIEIANDFATEKPQVVTVQIAGLARQSVSQQIE